MEAAIFVTFIGIQAACKGLEKLCTEEDHWLHAAMQRLSRNHYVVWLFHPAVLHGMQEYVVHYVIYSGQIFASH